jgi:surface protein
MSIESAIFAVQRGGTQYGVAGSDLSNNLIADDILVLSRGGVTSKFTYTGSTDLIEDSDLFVCTDDDGVTKTVTGAQFKELFGPVVMPWEGRPSVWHIKNLNQELFLDNSGGTTYTAWDLDGTNERQIDSILPTEELVFVTNTDWVRSIFRRSGSTNDTAEWDFGEETDVSRVQYWTSTFWGCKKFNGVLGGNWNTSKSLQLESVFENCESFNQDISGWDTSNVTTMWSLFEGCTDFNQDISGWDTSSVTYMNSMFKGASSFSQDLSGWCVTNFTSEPRDFATNATAWTKPKPVWGTCPRGEDQLP